MIIFLIITFFAFAFIGIFIYTTRFFDFSGNPIAETMFHIIVQIDGTDPQFIKGILLYCIIVPLILAVVTTLIIYNKKIKERLSKIKIYNFINKYKIVFALIIFAFAFICLAAKMKLIEYIETYTKSSSLYEEEYVDPQSVDIDFDNKRNLIYIFVESVEISDYSKSDGGALDINCIPELYKLAEENDTFNNNNGFYAATNTEWTIAAMVGEHSGTPLTIPIGGDKFVTDNKFMPGITTIGDILENEGYNNTLLLGSDAVFGGRRYFFEKHGNYAIHDYNYYVDQGLIDYYVWWGFEDHALINFAKQELLELASNEKPFNLTMLTVDTHHPDGYECELCEDKYEEQIENVFACTSKQIYEFVEWIKQQDFYENTTIVIAGDHTSMSTTMSDLIDNYQRKVYFTIINPDSKLVETKNREICTFDLFPTTIAAIGGNIKGDKLGFGTNLYSHEQTLIEKLTKEGFFSRISKHSSYYDNQILYGFK